MPAYPTQAQRTAALSRLRDHIQDPDRVLLRLADLQVLLNPNAQAVALAAENERLRAVLDGPPICVCGGTFTEVEYAADEGSPAAFGYHCPDCGWQIGNNGEITERLTLRTNPQTERLIARIFGR